MCNAYFPTWWSESSPRRTLSAKTVTCTEVSDSEYIFSQGGVPKIIRGKSSVHTQLYVLDCKSSEHFFSSELPSATPRKTCWNMCNIYFPTGVPGILRGKNSVHTQWHVLECLSSEFPTGVRGILRGKSLVHTQWHVLECLSSECIISYWCPGNPSRKTQYIHSGMCRSV